MDVWALGMLVLKMCLCSPLIHIRDPVKVLQYIDTNGPPRLTKKKYIFLFWPFVSCIKFLFVFFKKNEKDILIK